VEEAGELADEEDSGDGNVSIEKRHDTLFAVSTHDSSECGSRQVGSRVKRLTKRKANSSGSSKSSGISMLIFILNFDFSIIRFCLVVCNWG